ncbi:glycerol-3-phosphate O-acyltransferase, chloroplast [Artemisia annua]|uniref:Glycerol-3-phosphate O-acyltransferase, chloroplast n=1 Tax=Artemisia annua TaxID=35608 RepID=A0A2U1LBG6_ARTAN|nr:glycerol-3-phosphate O-acyltransferase, chloroplast [Artemisia annua]
MSLALDCILSNVKDPFEFLLYHEAIREPFNYYMFVQNYIRPVINFRESFVGNIFLFYQMEEQLKKGWLSSGGMAPAAAVEVGTDDSMMVDKLPKQINDMKIIDDMVEKG